MTDDDEQSEQHWDFTFTSSTGDIEVHSGRDLARAGKILVADLLDAVDDEERIGQILAFFLVVEDAPARLLLAQTLQTLVGTLLKDTVEHWPPFRQATEAMSAAMRASAARDAQELG